MMNTIDPGKAVKLRSFVVLQTAQGTKHAFGRVVSYTDAPTFTIELGDGRQISWRADLCKYADSREIALALGLAWEQS
jgi:hypothetical protein